MQVRLSHLASGTSTLLCHTANAVLDLHVPSTHDRLWVASAASSLECWDLRDLVVPAAGFGGSAGGTPQARAAVAAADPAAAQPRLLREPLLTIGGSAGIKRCVRPRCVHARARV